MTPDRFISESPREQAVLRFFSLVPRAGLPSFPTRAAAVYRGIYLLHDAEFGQGSLPFAMTLRGQEGDWKKTINSQRSGPQIKTDSKQLTTNRAGNPAPFPTQANQEVL